MPRQLVQEENATIDDINEALLLVPDSSLTARFNETHLDLVVGFVNETLCQESGTELTRQDLTDLLYANILSEGRLARSLPLIEGLNQYKEPINKEKFYKEYKPEEALQGLFIGCISGLFVGTVWAFAFNPIIPSVGVGVLIQLGCAVLGGVLGDKIEGEKNADATIEKSFNEAQAEWRKNNFDVLKETVLSTLERVESGAYPVRFKEMKIPKMQACI